MNIGAGPVFWYISPTPLILPLRHTELSYSTVHNKATAEDKLRNIWTWKKQKQVVEL